VYKNAILSTIVSSTNGTSYNFISKALRATRYSLKKAIVKRVHVDETGEDIWGDICVVTLALGSRPRQGLARVRAKTKLGSHISCSRKCKRV
jgi:hypothetical protein